MTAPGINALRKHVRERLALPRGALPEKLLMAFVRGLWMAISPAERAAGNAGGALPELAELEAWWAAYPEREPPRWRPCVHGEKQSTVIICTQCLTV